MIFIQKDTLNKVVLTLCESSTLLTPFYIFEFTNIADPTIIIIWKGPDFSTSVNRYNLFHIEDATGGCEFGDCNNPVDFIRGQWTYRVYESEFDSFDLNLAEPGIVESGRMMVASNDFFNDNNISDGDGVYI